MAPGTIIATGAFEGRGASGRIEITANGSAHGFDVALTEIAPLPAADSSLELNSLPASASDDELRSAFSYYRYEKLAAVPDQAFSSPPRGYGGFESNDPRYMRTAVIWAALPGISTGFGSVLATASLTWNLPHMDMELEVIDHGSSAGARGETALADDGTPVSYRVAAGDTAIGITARFGVTKDELEWLNPDRLPGRMLLEDITLNLSPESRGIRW